MKRKTVEAFLEMQINEETIRIKGSEEYNNSQVLIDYLSEGVDKGLIKACTPKQEMGYTSYKFEVYDYNHEFKNYFVVKVRNNERYLHRETLNKIKQITKNSNLIKKVNFNRFIAGIAISLILLRTAGPAIGRGLGRLFDKELEYSQDKSAEYSNSIMHKPTEEELTQAELYYYEDLRIRAENGDEKAQEEYERYLFEQEIKQQREENANKSIF